MEGLQGYGAQREYLRARARARARFLLLPLLLVSDHTYPPPRVRSQLDLQGLPDAVSDEMLHSDEDFLRTFHHILLEVQVEEGALVCPETGRRFPISKGIPNLLLNEDEC